MRKGFILTLTALATTFLVTSAVALGPTVSGVPDVYIGPAAAVGAPAETGTNTFRYSGALTLWDYVTPGVATGDGSGSDTLYQAWAAKDATLSGPTGSYLAAGSGVHYSIIQDGNATDALFLSPAAEVGDSGWAAEINNALNAQGASLSDYSLGNAGALTFRNVRLSPLPEQGTYPAPTAVSGLPAGVLDAQEATLYVSDTNTTPGSDKVLLVTVDTGADTLSGGLKWTMVQDYSADTSAFVAYKLSGKDTVTAPDTAATAIVMTNTGTSLSIFTPVANAPDASWYYYAQYDTLQAAVDPANIYRVKASLTAPGGASNASILLSFNARGNAGYAFTQLNQGTALGPNSTPSDWSGFMVPVEAGTPQAQFIVFDSSSSVGGTVTASSIQVQSIDLAAVKASASVAQATSSSFPVAASGNASATEWGYFGAALGVSPVTIPTFTRTPANGASGPLVMSAVTSTDPLNLGFASFQGPTASIPTTAGKLVLVRAKLSTSSSPSAKLPTVWMNAEAPTLQAGMLIERDNAGTSGPTTSAKDYYLVFEARDAVCAFNLRVLADKASINGNVQMTELEVLEADMPSEP
jgi:hypothetical protein